MQVCTREVTVAMVRVPSSSGKDVYTVKVIGDAAVSCSCPGFTYRGKCKHLAVSRDACGWNEGCDDKQTGRQHQLHICPRCGGITDNVLAESRGG